MTITARITVTAAPRAAPPPPCASSLRPAFPLDARVRSVTVDGRDPPLPDAPRRRRAARGGRRCPPARAAPARARSSSSRRRHRRLLPRRPARARLDQRGPAHPALARGRRLASPGRRRPARPRVPHRRPHAATSCEASRRRDRHARAPEEPTSSSRSKARPSSTCDGRSACPCARRPHACAPPRSGRLVPRTSSIVAAHPSLAGPEEQLDLVTVVGATAQRNVLDAWPGHRRRAERRGGTRGTVARRSDAHRRRRRHSSRGRVPRPRASPRPARSATWPAGPRQAGRGRDVAAHFFFLRSLTSRLSARPKTAAMSPLGIAWPRRSWASRNSSRISLLAVNRISYLSGSARTHDGRGADSAGAVSGLRRRRRLHASSCRPVEARPPPPSPAGAGIFRTRSRDVRLGNRWASSSSTARLALEGRRRQKRAPGSRPSDGRRPSGPSSGSARRSPASPPATGNRRTARATSIRL